MSPATRITVYGLDRLFAIGRTVPEHYQHLMRQYAAFICDHCVDFPPGIGNKISDPEEFGSEVLANQLAEGTLGAVASSRSVRGVQLYALMIAMAEVRPDHVLVNQTPVYWSSLDMPEKVNDDIKKSFLHASILQLLPAVLRTLPREHRAVQQHMSGAARYLVRWQTPGNLRGLLVTDSHAGLGVDVVAV